MSGTPHGGLSPQMSGRGHDDDSQKTKESCEKLAYTNSGQDGAEPGVGAPAAIGTVKERSYAMYTSEGGDWILK